MVMVWRACLRCARYEIERTSTSFLSCWTGYGGSLRCSSSHSPFVPSRLQLNLKRSGQDLQSGCVPSLRWRVAPLPGSRCFSSNRRLSAGEEPGGGRPTLQQRVTITRDGSFRGTLLS